jgi:hypothetical protein
MVPAVVVARFKPEKLAQTRAQEMVVMVLYLQLLVYQLLTLVAVVGLLLAAVLPV